MQLALNCSMKRQGGYTLVEVLAVVAVIVILVAVLAPSIGAARESARRAACASQMHGISNAVLQYSVENRHCLMPFIFSDERMDLPLSGHFGGNEQAQLQWMYKGSEVVNLQSLVHLELVQPEALLCPGWRSREGSFFPHTRRFSTYCLRFPPSNELFDGTMLTAPVGKPVLSRFAVAAGGQNIMVSKFMQTMPQVRMDRTYRIELAGKSYVYEPAGGALLSDGFWHNDSLPASAGAAGLARHAVNQDRCHGRYFNVLSGEGSVSCIRDDGTIAAIIPAGQPAADGLHYATYAEGLWRFFESRR